MGPCTRSPEIEVSAFWAMRVSFITREMSLPAFERLKNSSDCDIRCENNWVRISRRTRRLTHARLYELRYEKTPLATMAAGMSSAIQNTFSMPGPESTPDFRNWVGLTTDWPGARMASPASLMTSGKMPLSTPERLPKTNPKTKRFL